MVLYWYCISDIEQAGDLPQLGSVTEGVSAEGEGASEGESSSSQC